MSKHDLRALPPPPQPSPPMRRLGEKMAPHPWDGLRAMGEWIVAEQVAALETTSSGSIIIPDSAQMPIWMVVSVGKRVNKVHLCKLAEKLKSGDRVLFGAAPPAPQLLAYEGRTFAMLLAAQIIAVLPMPKPEEIRRIEVAPAAALSVLERQKANGAS